MAKERLNYGEYRRISKEEDPIAFKAKRFVNTLTGEKVSGARARKLAGSTATSRMTAAEKLSHAVPTMIHATEMPKVSETLRNRRAYAEKYGVSLRSASQAAELKILNKEWQRDLKRLQKLEGSRKKRDPQSPEEVALRKKLSDTAKALGRKRQDDYRDFGSTDSIS